ncbi:MAG: histidinol-phosphatase HisJ family protein [Acidaminococcales bacterium]|nr:histidinol-phosphatase HisJ family protein [Acidaminococcales bacterium]
MFDTHLHTTFSCDSRMDHRQALSAAQKLGIGIIITEHLDLDYPENPEEFVFDFNEYFATLNPLRKESELLLGLELGLRAECAEKNKEIIKGWPFDEIIGSIHVVDGIDIYSPAYTLNNEKKAVYGRYLAVMADCVRDFDDFDTLGHVDYICRYAAYSDRNLYIDDFYAEWSAVCAELLKKEKVLEINTRRFDDKTAVACLFALYRRYRELGGKYVTIGSDAHCAENVGRGIAAAWEMAESIGLRPVYYKNRKMFFDRKEQGGALRRTK